MVLWMIKNIKTQTPSRYDLITRKETEGTEVKRNSVQERQELAVGDGEGCFNVI